MAQGHLALTEKEKQTLRLLLAGHDAKSMARHLGLSVHTVNERLRDSRRKLSASSSREAARLLRDAESDIPQSVVDNQLGAAATLPGGQHYGPSTAGSPSRQTVWIAGVVVMMSLVLALFVLSPVAPQGAAPVASVAQAETPAVQSARQWLEMGDASDWKGSWAATGASFRKVNSLAVWTSVSEKVRVPLGAVVSRALTNADEVPTPPQGNIIVKFRTRFANGANAVETIALAREDGSLKVVGCYIEQG
jgi:DNA-binding CsgD family transcriptional regulator